MRNKQLTVLTFATTLLFTNPVLAQMTGETWLKLSDDAKVGYTIGLLDATAIYSAKLEPSKQFHSIAEEIADCMVKRKISYPVLESAITARVKQHSSALSQDMRLFAAVAIFDLCIP